MFEVDFHAALRIWRGQGDRLLIFMDANEHVLEGRFMRRLLEDEKLNLTEKTHRVWGGDPPNTFLMGSDPIDTVLKTEDLELGGLRINSFDESSGDHRTIVVDVSTMSMIGKYENKVVRPECRRLTTSCEKSVIKYNGRVEKQMDVHRMDERLAKVSWEASTYPANEEASRKLEQLDTQMIEIQINAESKCRRLIRASMPFSEPAKVWHKRKRSYKELIKRMEGKVRNVSNVIKRAKAMGITNPKQLTRIQLEDGVRYCKARQRAIKPFAPGLRKVHLRNCYIAAKDKGDDAKANEVRRVIEREENDKIWYRINRVTDDPR